MKIIYKIHPLTYIVALIFIFLGKFKFYINFMLILLIHELGHIVCARIYKWKIKKILLLPLGILLKFEDNLNKPLYEELLISIMGIVFQFIFIFFIHSDLLIFCSNIIFVFNILPIYPLDGSKIINILLNKITNFKTSYFLTLVISLVTIIILMVISFINSFFIGLLSFFPLLINLIELFCNKDKVFLKFLLERYLYDFKFTNIKYIFSVDEMKRDYYHYIRSNSLVSEKDYLKDFFNV